MNYTVLLRPAARKDLDKLDDPLYSRIIKSLKELEKEPTVKTAKLTGRKNLRRKRIGDYRILFEIIDRSKRNSRV